MLNWRELFCSLALADLDEDDETIVLSMGAVTGATVSGLGVHTFTVLDDDAAPSAACAVPRDQRGS